MGVTNVELGAGAETVEVTWNWAAQIAITGFDPEQDQFDFNALASEDLAISEVDGNLVLEVTGNGGHKITVQDTQAEDLTLANFIADDWNTVLDNESGVVNSLSTLGMDVFV